VDHADGVEEGREMLDRVSRVHEQAAGDRPSAPVAFLNELGKTGRAQGARGARGERCGVGESDDRGFRRRRLG
jgi:hypothetical protein